MFHRNMTKY